MESIPILALMIGFIATVIFFGSRMDWRRQLANLGYVPFAWMMLIMGGFVRVSDLPNQLERFTGPMFAVLLLAGALSYAEREVPKRLLPCTAGTGLALTLVAMAGFPREVRLACVAIEQIFLLTAVVIVYSAAKRDDRSFVDRLIAPGLVILAVVDIMDHRFSGSEDAFGVLPWFLIGVPLSMLQAASSFERLRVRAEEADSALEATVSELEAALESTADGILVVDRHGRQSRFNQRFAEMWLIPEDILALRDDELSLEYVMSMLNDPTSFMEGVKALYANPEKTSFDTLELTDGRVFERYSQPQRVGDEIVGRVWSFRDVTGRKQAEDVASRYRRDLEELVEERTRELFESRERLREVDRLAAIGTLAAGVAHQINNPVGAILNSAEYALLCKDDDDANSILVRSLNECVQEARRCGTIVRSMLQFARDEPTEMQVDDLNEVVQRACRVASIYAREHSIELQVDLAESSLPVRMSAIELEQVVVNIVRNAVESIEDRGRIRVHTDRTSDLARVHIIDDGRGISAQEQSRVFDPFYSTRLRDGGTGLGLSVAHGIVAQHDGHLSLSSEVGHGTELTIELPISEPGAMT